MANSVGAPHKATTTQGAPSAWTRSLDPHDTRFTVNAHILPYAYALCTRADQAASTRPASDQATLPGCCSKPLAAARGIIQCNKAEFLHGLLGIMNKNKMWIGSYTFIIYCARLLCELARYVGKFIRRHLHDLWPEMKAFLHFFYEFGKGRGFTDGCAFRANPTCDTVVYVPESHIGDLEPTFTIICKTLVRQLTNNLRVAKNDFETASGHDKLYKQEWLHFAELRVKRANAEIRERNATLELKEARQCSAGLAVLSAKRRKFV